MNRLDFIKKIGLATVGLPLLSSFGLPEAYLSVEDQVEREKLDLNLYKEMEGKNYIIKPNGNIIHSMSKGDPSVYYEIINEYPYYQIYREFYPDDYLKCKQHILDNVNFGKSIYYDKNGKLTIVNEDKKFGKIKIDFIMKFLERNGMIDLKTGKGWYDLTDLSFSYDLSFDMIEGEKFWIVTKKYGVRYDSKIHGISKHIPPTYLPITWYIDGETGQVYTEEEFENRNKSPKTTRTF